MNATPKTTSVFKKPEFWVTLVTSVAGLLMAFGVITPEQAKSIGEYTPNLIGALLSLLSTAKFVNAQTTAKVEVFRAMCAMRLEAKGKGPDGKPTAQGATSIEDEVLNIARMAGL